MNPSGSFPQGVRVNKDQGREGGGMNRVFISLRPLVPKKVGKVSLALQKGTIPGQAVPLLIWVVPLLIWWGVGKHMVIMLSQFN